MTEQNIASMIRKRRLYESELLILKDCSDHIRDSDDTSGILRYTLLKRRLALIEHWLYLLPVEESQLLQMHLVERQSWKSIAEQIAADSTRDIACDARSLQRAQAKALSRLEVFMNSAFGNSLDFLIDSEGHAEEPI